MIKTAILLNASNTMSTEFKFTIINSRSIAHSILAIAIFALLPDLVNSSTCLAQGKRPSIPSKVTRAAKSAKKKIVRSVKKAKRLTKSAAKGFANKIGLRVPRDRRIIVANVTRVPAGPQRPAQVAGAPRQAIQYGVPPDPIIYTRLPNLAAPQPRLVGQAQFNDLVRQSPVDTGTVQPAVRPAGQYQQRNNLNVVDAVARNLYGPNFRNAQPGANTLNRLAVERAGAARPAVRQYPPANPDANAMRPANRAARPYMHPIPPNLTRRQPNSN